MATLTNEERVQLILSTLEDGSDITSMSLTGDGGVRDFTVSLTAIATGETTETTLTTDWTDEELATFALPYMRAAIYDLWVGGRSRLELSAAQATAATAIDSIDLGTDEAEPT